MMSIACLGVSTGCGVKNDTASIRVDRFASSPTMEMTMGTVLD